MATSWSVAGPCDIYVNNSITNAGASGTWSLLGRTTNEEMAQITLTRYINETTTTASGGAPEQMVTQNQTATIAFVLATYDTTVLDALRDRLAGGSAAIMDVGMPMNDDTTPLIVGVRIVPRIAGRTQWEFPYCYMTGDAEGIGPHGNTPAKVGMTFKATPVPSTNRLYTKTTTT